MYVENFDVDSFITTQTYEIRRILGDERAIIAVSGGVDSTTCAALTRKAIGNNLVCVFIDTGFMRKGEPQAVKRNLARQPLKLPLRIVRAQKYFMKNLKGLVDAEEKRKSFRESFYSTLGDAAKKEECVWLVQGTIAPDLIETKGGVKTQHNVLEQIGIDPKEKYGFKVIEPLASLYKPQVRTLSRRLGFPEGTSERQPFPGPGLMVRCIGEVSPTKLSSLKIATSIVEKELKDLGAQQYFAAIADDEPQGGAAAARFVNSLSKILQIQDLFSVHILSNLATGVSGGQRVYGKIAAVSLSPAGKTEAERILEKASISSKDLIATEAEYTRLLVEIGRAPRRRTYAAIIRAVKTEDFMTAKVPPIPWRILRKISSKITKSCGNVSSVYYDLTPKPPATIEFE